MARKKARMSQEKLGVKIGLSRPSVTNIESGIQRVSIHKLYNISRVLGVGSLSLLPKESEVIYTGKATLPKGLSNQEIKFITKILNGEGVEVKQ